MDKFLNPHLGPLHWLGSLGFEDATMGHGAPVLSPLLVCWCPCGCGAAACWLLSAVETKLRHTEEEYGEEVDKKYLIGGARGKIVAVVG
jgi:hypothetical protein